MYRLRNYSEEIVDKLIDDVLSSYKDMDICRCIKCKLDIKAYVLNRIKPKYVVSEQGEIYTRALNEINKQEFVTIIETIMHAIEIVKSNPKHN